MSVQELLDKLNKVKNKTIPVRVVEMGWYGDSSQEEVECAEVCIENNFGVNYNNATPVEYFWISSL